jgi:F0F1-type ATP synthase assembly protein I
LKKKFDPKSTWGNYGKYSGMAFQMIFIILIGTFLGKFLDSRLEFRQPTFTVAFALISIGIALYIVLKEK